MLLKKYEVYTRDDFPEGCIEDCSHSGQCIDDVKFWVKELELDADNDEMKEYLKRFGAWDDEELEDKEDNLERMLWIICNDIKEQDEAYFGL